VGGLLCTNPDGKNISILQLLLMSLSGIIVPRITVYKYSLESERYVGGGVLRPSALQSAIIYTLWESTQNLTSGFESDQ